MNKRNNLQRQTRQNAVSAATTVIGWPLAIAAIGCSILIGVQEQSMGAIPLLLVSTMLVAAMATIVAGDLIGAVAYRLTNQSQIPVRHMGAALAGVLWCFAIGWVIFFLNLE